MQGLQSPPGPLPEPPVLPAPAHLPPAARMILELMLFTCLNLPCLHGLLVRSRLPGPPPQQLTSPPRCAHSQNWSDPTALVRTPHTSAPLSFLACPGLLLPFLVHWVNSCLLLKTQLRNPLLRDRTQSGENQSQARLEGCRNNDDGFLKCRALPFAHRLI